MPRAPSTPPLSWTRWPTVSVHCIELCRLYLEKGAKYTALDLDQMADGELLCNLDEQEGLLAK